MGLGSRISHQKMADVVIQSLPGIIAFTTTSTDSALAGLLQSLEAAGCRKNVASTMTYDDKNW